MRLGALLLLLSAGAFAAASLIDQAGVMHWVVAQQRAFQNEMAEGVFGLKTGSPGAWTGLLAAAAAYGFVHALGPGHGKYLIGGVGLGSKISTPRLLSIALASSLAQSLWAIVLVFGGFWLLDATAARVTALAEGYLAAASYIAIGAIGLLLVLRGMRAVLRQGAPAGAAHGDGCGCNGHGPTPQQVEALGSTRDLLALVTSIAIRPCTGAIFLLVIAWQMDIRLAGAVAVVVMGLGTAALTSLVAISSTAARSLTIVSTGRIGGAAAALPALQIVTGAAILWISAILFATMGP